MKIFYLSFGRSGCSKWRSEIPTKYLRRRGHVVNSADDGSIPDCPDVIVFSRQYDSDVFRLYNWAKGRGIRVIYETDDALDLVDPWNPAFEFCRLHRKEAEFMATHADAVTTTTPELAEKLRQLNPNVIVIPNSVDPEEWTVHPRGDAATCIGWLGGSTHFLDLAIAADALTEVARKNKLRVVIYGLTTMPSIDLMYRKSLEMNGEKFRSSHVGKAVKVFLRKTEKLRYEFQPFVSPSEYADTLCRLKFDIGIAPLADTAFNSNKSCIKYYEYAMSGAVTIASNVLPYSTEVPILAENTTEAWKQRLLDVLSSDREALWEAQYDWIMTHRNIETQVEAWERVLAGDTQMSALNKESDVAAQFVAV